MQKILVAGALVLASVGIAGVASASDDCAVAPIPGFYGAVCLFNDHSSSFASCSPWGCSSSSSSYNQLAGATASGSGVFATGGTSQYASNYASCTFGTCSSGNSDSTSVSAYRGGAGSYNAASVNQGRSSSTSPWGSSSFQSTTVNAGSGAGPLGVNAGANQFAYQSGSFGYCYTYAYVFTSFGGGSTPTIACTQNTPAGPVNTQVPNLYTTCVNTGTPAGSVCARYPDMPDGTGLPFL